jgi:GGDEF domain-containing protein
LERHGDDGLDAVAAAVAQRLRAHFGAATLGRLRDNAFCVVVPDGGAEELGDRLAALQRDVAALMVPFRFGALRPAVRVGVGGQAGQPLTQRLADARRVAVDGAMAAR